MVQLVEGSLAFRFPAGWDAIKYDDSAHYRRNFQSFAGGSKAVDFVAFGGTSDELWLIEVKDYRVHERLKPVELFDEIADKVRSTLAGLLAMRANASDGSEHFAARAMEKRRLRVVLHLEQPQKPSKLFPKVIDPKDARQKLRKVMRAVDPHALIGGSNDLNSTVAWQTIAATELPR